MKSDDKLKHLEHVEDLHLGGAGSSGFRHAHQVLDHLHTMLTGGKHPVKVTTKLDGSPSVVWGHHPENGKFFVASKSAFNKNPKLNYTHEDIEKNHGHAPGLVDKLKHALNHLPKITPKKGVFQGDIMHAGDVKEEGDKVSFTPNTITYSAHKDSEHGRSAKAAKLGIAPHTTYEGKKFEDLKAVVGTGSDGFKEHPAVHVVRPEYEHKPSWKDGESATKAKKHLNAAHKSFQTLTAAASTQKQKPFDHLAGHEVKVKTYINSTVRSGETPSVGGYKKWLHSWHDKNIQGYKSVAGRARATQSKQQQMQHLQKHQSLFGHSFSIHRHLQNAKNAIVDALAHSANESTGFEHHIRGTPTTPEGFVAVHKKHPVKLVHRHDFSKQNFIRDTTS